MGQKCLRPKVLLLTIPRWCFFCGSVFGFYVSSLSLISCVVCSLQPCDHLLGKGWPLGSLVFDVYLCFCHFPIWCLGSGVVLVCIDPWYLPSSLLRMVFTIFDMMAILVMRS